MDIESLALSKSFARQQISIGVTNIQLNEENDGLMFTLADTTVVTVSLNGLISAEERLKLTSLNDTLLSRFSYTTELLFDGQPIDESKELLNYYNKIEVDDKISVVGTDLGNHILDKTNPHDTELFYLKDVTITSPADKQVIGYDIGTSKWINQSVSISGEKVKATSTATSKYLDGIVDGATCVIENDSLVVKKLDGQTVSIAEINTLLGMNGNIKSILNSLASAGMSFKGVKNTKLELDAMTEMIIGELYIVLVDESQSSLKTSYIYDGTEWISLGENDVNIRDFSVDKVDLTIEVKNILPKSNMDLTGIATIGDLAGYETITDLQTNYASKAELSSKVNSVDIVDDLISIDIDKPLSAKQGKVLKDLVSTEVTAINTELDTKLEASNIVAGSNITLGVVGNDITISSIGGGTGAGIDDINISNTTTYSSEKVENIIDNLNISVNEATETMSGTIMLAGDLGGTSSNPIITGINGVEIDSSNISNGRLLGYNNTTGRNEYMDINITGIVGSANIVVPSGSSMTLISKQEAVIIHPEVADDKMMINVQEQVTGASTSDSHLDFSNTNQYTFQDINKMVLESNKAELNVKTNILMHMNENATKDEIGHTITNSGVVLNTDIKKFGTGSAYFSGAIGTQLVSTSNDYDFSGNFTVDFWLMSTTTNNDMHTLQVRDVPSGGFAIHISNNIISYFDTNNVTPITVIGTIIKDTWNHFAMVRNNNVTKFYINGIVSTYIPNTFAGGNLKTILLGNRYDGNYPFTGYIDEFRVSKKAVWTSNFTVPAQYELPYAIANTPTYLKTTGITNFNVLSISKFTSLTIPVATPTDTSVKCLFSVDNRANWLYKDGTGIHVYSGSMEVDWVNSNTNIELQTYFTNLTLEQLTSDLSGLGIIPTTLDFCFQLNSSNINITPTISTITLVYLEADHTEYASYGSYDETNVKFGIKRLSSTKLGIKNLSTITRSVKLNILLGN